MLSHTAIAQRQPIAPSEIMIDAQKLGGIETIEMVSKLDPNKAALLSAALPGLGQIYNGEFWKLPVIYGGGLIIGHFIYYNHDLYNTFNYAMIADVSESPFINNPFPRFNRASLQRNRDFYKRNRDFMIIVGVAYYMLNIVEAHISAHLKEFNVNEDLSLKFKPSIEPIPYSGQVIGVGIALTIK